MKVTEVTITMSDVELEEWSELKEEVKDSEFKVDRAKVDLDNAERWYNEEKVNQAEAIIELDKFEKKHNIKI